MSSAGFTLVPSPAAEPAAARITVPILVGITGKRADNLAALGVTDEAVRSKLRLAFSLVEMFAPHSPKILLCGMADGVDEIAARLVIEERSKDKGDRLYRTWYRGPSSHTGGSLSR